MLGDSLLAAVWLYTADMERAARFYTETLGLRFIGEPGHVTHLDAGNIRLSLHPWPDGPREPVGSFFVFVVEDVEAGAAELRRRGVDVRGEIQEAPFGRIVEFRDPDGHELYLFELPRPDSPEFEHVAPIVEQYGRLRARLQEPAPGSRP
jgi:predicted enzyme related to lactoylglutathione lyase